MYSDLSSFHNLVDLACQFATEGHVNSYLSLSALVEYSLQL